MRGDAGRARQAAGMRISGGDLQEAAPASHHPRLVALREEPRRRLRRGRSQSLTLQGAHPPTSHTRTPSPTMASLRWPSGRGRRISGGDSQEAARSPLEVIADLDRWATHAAHLGLHRAEAAPPVVVPILPPENHPREEPEPSPSSTIGTSSDNPVHRPVCADMRYGQIGVGVSLVGFAPQPHLPLPWCRRSPLVTHCRPDLETEDQGRCS
ncbi:unnamed protein product [Urochloa humidicola]